VIIDHDPGDEHADRRNNLQTNFAAWAVAQTCDPRRAPEWPSPYMDLFAGIELCKDALDAGVPYDIERCIVEWMERATELLREVGSI